MTTIKFSSKTISPLLFKVIKLHMRNASLLFNLLCLVSLLIRNHLHNVLPARLQTSLPYLITSKERL
ncbi:transmembrane protein, putative [Medicago truncatula]|uniref:Transmembrane protein, putative n=1 Tax=Medicago truncatula TaxID=3880 RepID=A0A072TW29_MEDTR|nr:transmembrane protein, putative [Medicago truncatula]